MIESFSEIMTLEKTARFFKRGKPALYKTAREDKIPAVKIKIKKDAATYFLRTSFATHLFQSGYDIRTIQELLGHLSACEHAQADKNVKTTMIYTYVINQGGQGVRSPADF